MAMKDKERYEKEKANWAEDSENESSDSAQPPMAKKSSRKKKRRTVKARPSSSDDSESETPHQAKQSAYITFCRDTREQLQEENKNWSTIRVTKEIEKMWESMDEEEREQYA